PLMFLILFVPLAGCARYQVKTTDHPVRGRPGLIWRTELRWDDDGTAIVRGGKVCLLIEGRTLLISDDPFGPYTPVEVSDYDSYDIPKDALAGGTAWWAGFGETVYVVRQTGPEQLAVYSRQARGGETPH